MYDLASRCVLSTDINVFTCQSYNVSYNIPLGVPVNKAEVRGCLFSVFA